MATSTQNPSSFFLFIKAFKDNSLYIIKFKQRLHNHELVLPYLKSNDILII
jgi:hypothetical protein